MKIKADLLHRRDDEKRKSEERDYRSSKTIGPGFFSPPAPPLPAKYDANPSHALNFDPAKFVAAMASSSSGGRPHSLLAASTPTGGLKEDCSERESLSEESSMSNSESNTNSNTKESSSQEEENKASRRVTSTGDVQPSIHTPV